MTWIHDNLHRHRFICLNKRLHFLLIFENFCFLQFFKEIMVENNVLTFIEIVSDQFVLLTINFRKSGLFIYVPFPTCSKQAAQ